ncbi:hypothetical protein SAMN02745857_02795 [Andreprevotia lacus DSM 23236]|jgi:hypothetical protein|uniref:Uncharacterized protein n=1 Tax=Andreprevotia lacus DSM 23236 TaxID=1121001 RepID=A0A1W1XUV0_9NEIS|nr:hypothetical protein [Andreprevotia lacus]SMC27298.1 hypothetical protein SAMN02745857_02795 [Andreprevotia lacus DSM 23236]
MPPFRPTLLASTCAVLAATALLAGCSTPSVAEQWGTQFRALQMYPVFPPREDVQPGDILAVCNNRASSKTMPISAHLYRLPGIKALLGHYYADDSIDLPPNQNLASGAMAERNDIFNATPVQANRLRNVAFPDTFAARLAKEDIAAVIPAGVTLNNATIGASQFRSGALSIPSASSYGLPTTVLLPPLMTELEADNSPLLAVLDAYGQTSPCGTNGTLQLMLVQEVYLANTIKLQLETDNETAAKLQTSFIPAAGSTIANTIKSVLAAHQAQTASAAAPTGKPTASAPATVPPGQFDPQTVADEITQKLTTLGNAQSEDTSLPNAKVGISVGSTGSISMSKTFVHPVVVGFSGVSIGLQQAEHLIPDTGTKTASGTNASSPPAAAGYKPSLKLVLKNLAGNGVALIYAKPGSKPAERASAPVKQ